jgi:DNA-binding LacI/PurR family transcriptional regulator
MIPTLTFFIAPALTCRLPRHRADRGQAGGLTRVYETGYMAWQTVECCMAARGRAAGTAPVTITEVAEAAGVSRATVSRAFTQPNLLSRETIERVRAVAERFGYVPNSTARALSTGRAGNIALIVPDITNPFFAALMRGAQARARDRGYATFLGDSDETPQLEDVLLGKLGAQVDGFILVSTRLPRTRVEGHAGRRPLIVVNRDIPGLSRLLVDTGPAYAAGVEHLAALGHRSIAYVAGPAMSWSNRQRGTAVAQAAGRSGLRLTRIGAARPSYESGEACTGELLKCGATAALAFDDVIAQGIMAGLARRGLSVPADFSLIGCDGEVAVKTYPPLTSVTTRCFEAGERATDLLLDVLGSGGRPPCCVRFPSELVLRATTAAPSPRSAVWVASRNAEAAGWAKVRAVS